MLGHRMAHAMYRRVRRHMACRQGESEAMQPKYQLVAGTLREEIRSGRYRDTMLLPTEYELCSQFHMSRQTVRQALSLLASEGLIERRQGSGSHILATPSPAASPRAKAVLPAPMPPRQAITSPGRSRGASRRANSSVSRVLWLRYSSKSNASLWPANRTAACCCAYIPTGPAPCPYRWPAPRTPHRRGRAG